MSIVEFVCTLDCLIADDADIHKHVATAHLLHVKGTTTDLLHLSGQKMVRVGGMSIPDMYCAERPCCWFV